MKYCFTCYGHENILGTHQRTVEFTKDKDLSLKGDCIIGVNADFDLSKIREFIKKISINKKIIKIIIKNNNKKETITAKVNPDFNDDKDIVVRMSNFLCKRTLAINADKSCFELDRELIDSLKDKKVKIEVCLEGI